MFDVTESAINKFKEILIDIKEEGGIRIFNAGGGCCGTPALALDVVEKPNEDDILINKEDVKIYLDITIADLLSDSILDYNDHTGFNISGLQQDSCCS